ncbi:acyl-CoA dehydrogenase family protein [Gluconobacter sp. Dm-62]|uniref:acyl-CoA dehydrogenase family protein n=1 Tax=Gluconobacter sp. Dm-62 TaxID=2799804 RepID=UPI001B8D213D|nr:acyl-CoA dehydrogenase family protein [Gluconobacter sp. Dm-62]MBS1103127.1 acyl-CoA dehydrogenase family protein [Gluconobacter sp. Dm-62]
MIALKLPRTEEEQMERRFRALQSLVPPCSVPVGLKEFFGTLGDVIGREIAPRAVENDRLGRYPRASISALKACGLMKAPLPVSLGGLGFSQALSQEVFLELGIADPSVAQIYKVHDDAVRELLSVGSPEFCRRLAERICLQNAIVGMAISENGKRAVDFGHVVSRPAGSGYFIDGRKVYATGAVGADLLLVSSYDLVAGAVRLDLVPAGTDGVRFLTDWDRLGQRATDSGSVVLEHVQTQPDWSVLTAQSMPQVHAPLRYQNGFSMILTGIGLAALEAGVRFARENSRPWASARVETAADDLLVRRLFGEIGAELAAACSSVRTAAALLDAFDRGECTRTDVAIPVYAARSSASRAALRAASDLMSALGAKATDAVYGFDRYWRDARTLSLHDPVEWKHEEIGRHLLTGWEPEPGLYQ